MEAINKTRYWVPDLFIKLPDATKIKMLEETKNEFDNKCKEEEEKRKLLKIMIFSQSI